MRMSWIIGAAVLVAAAIAAAFYLLREGEPVQAARVEPGEVRQFVDERAVTRLPNIHLVTMPFAARIDDIELEEGDRVAAGQVVAQIVSTDIENEVAEAQAAVERLEASIAENEDVSIELKTLEQAQQFVKSMAATVAAAAARVEAGKERLDYSETYLGRVRKLVPTGGKTEDELDRAQLDYAEDQIEYRQDVLVHTAAQALQAATNLLPAMVNDYIARKTLSRAVLQKEKSEAEARLRQVLTRKARSVLESPVDGVVLQREYRNEQYLDAGTLLLAIGRLEELEVEADVLSQDVVDIEPGDEVEVYGPAVGGELGAGVRATVHRINPAGFTKVSSLGVEQQRVKVIMRFAPEALERLLARDLGVDYRVNVRIFTERADNALLVPRSALFRGADGGWEVFAVRGGRAVLQPVSVGLLNDDVAQITEGLADGETVVLAPESSLSHGDLVKPVLRQ